MGITPLEEVMRAKAWGTCEYVPRKKKKETILIHAFLMQTQLRSTKIVLKLALWTMGQKVKLTLYFDSLLLSRVAQSHKTF